MPRQLETGLAAMVLVMQNGTGQLIRTVPNADGSDAMRSCAQPKLSRS
jgi:hypothetical protein